MGTAVADGILTHDISDDSLEIAGGMSALAQAGSSLWSTADASGCTCVA